MQFDAGAPAPGVTYHWNFSDGASVDGNKVSHTFGAVGGVSGELVATSSTGAVSRATARLLVEGVPIPAPRVANQLLRDCSGPHCGITADGQYAGSDVGVWRYRNDAAAAQIVNINIGGVTAAQSVTLLFSAGGKDYAASLPNAGAAAAGAAAASAGPTVRRAAAAAASSTLVEDDHTRLLRLNAEAADSVLQAPLRAAAATTPLRKATAAANDVGTQKVWNDIYVSAANPVKYTTQAYSVCVAPSGRRIVFWVDKTMIDAGTMPADKMQQLNSAVCGDKGLFARVTGMLGDVWGTAAKASTVISETADQKQDVNVAIVSKTSGTWGGYFYANNNFVHTSVANSNEALIFFIDGPGFVKDPQYYTSTFVHELTHMINYYQRTVARSGKTHEVWLEETSAMMTSDLMADQISPGKSTVASVDASSRLAGYIKSGAGINVMDWVAGGNNYYNGGATLGSFLNRKYGTVIYKQLITGCTDAKIVPTSWDCLDTLIRNNGGLGLEDEWERAGVSALGGTPALHSPWGYGYGRKDTSTDGLTLTSVDTSSLSATRSSGDPAKLTTFGKLTHSYVADKVTSGSGYRRNGVVVPAGTTLSVIVR